METKADGELCKVVWDFTEKESKEKKSELIISTWVQRSNEPG